MSEQAKQRTEISAGETRAVGAKMPDGSVYAGVSPNTQQPMYVTAVDAPLTMSFNEAAKYAAKLEVHGHRDWRPPTLSELKVLFDNRAAIGGFDTSETSPGAWYGSSGGDGKTAWGHHFSSGSIFSTGAGGKMALRCVRGEAAHPTGPLGFDAG